MTIPVLIILGVVLLDQTTKRYAEQGIDSLSSLGILYSTSGNILFLLPRQSSLYIWGLVAIITLLSAMYAGVLPSALMQVAIGSLLGGSLSNVIDWHFRGFVVDFTFGGSRANGNLADGFIWIGMASWILAMMEVML